MYIWIMNMFIMHLCLSTQNIRYRHSENDHIQGIPANITAVQTRRSSPNKGLITFHNTLQEFNWDTSNLYFLNNPVYTKHPQNHNIVCFACALVSLKGNMGIAFTSTYQGKIIKTDQIRVAYTANWLGPRQNGWHGADDIFRLIFLD